MLRPYYGKKTEKALWIECRERQKRLRRYVNYLVGHVRDFGLYFKDSGKL